MPELPEVETLRRQLQNTLPGRTIRDVWFSDSLPKLLRGPNEETFVESICGTSIVAVGRRGKWLILELSNRRSLVAHLRMTGRWFLRYADEPEDQYLRATITLDSGHELRWCDVRKFGTWDLVENPEEVTGASGAEPLSDDFTAETILKAAASRRAPIKSFLLDQRRIAGLGNIYTDEALWDSSIHPLRPAGSVSLAEANRLRDAIVRVLTDSIESGGSSMRDYLDSNGRAGRFQERWRVYKHEGRPCLRCGTVIVKIKVGGRGTHYCPTCQTAAASEAVSSVSATDDVTLRSSDTSG
jgi:formamidopyrimidine-DNA glycosylase